jgi:hypothetical protein
VLPPNTNAGANANANASNNATDEYRNGILMLARNFFNRFMTQTVNHTLNKLEAEETEEEDTEG